MFLFSLAGHLKKTVAELESMPMPEVVEWMAYYVDNPWDDRSLADQRAAMITAHIAAGNGTKNVKVSDFMPRYGTAKQMKKTKEQMAAELKAAAGIR